jgi:uncharacterized membrane protein
MRSRASLRNHPIHPMLVVFPIALWIFSLLCDIVYHSGSHNPYWKGMAFLSMLCGTVGALAAAIPGFIDYLAIRNAQAKRVAMIHMILNLIIVVLFIFNLGMRFSAPADPDQQLFATILSVIGVLLMAVSGWLGGTLVYIHHVGVEIAGDSLDEERRAA